MCGRYYISDELYDDIRSFVESGEADRAKSRFGSGDIRPSESAPAIVMSNDRFRLCSFTWGFESFSGNGLLINARSETAAQKQTFRAALEQSRCLLPASAFYEWNHEKEKFTFRFSERQTLYLAGLYRKNQFTILTTTANSCMKNIHDRMPVIFSQTDGQIWLKDSSSAKNLLTMQMPDLISECGYEQLSFF